MMKSAVIVSHLSKAFRRYHPGRPLTIQEALAQGISRIRPVERFWGLRDVSFRVAAGRTVGIIGANGSGKSTLLRLIGGVGRADSGSVEVHGRIGALLDLGVGFHPDLTGRENVLVAGVLSGLTRRQVLTRLDSIVAFAEVEKFIDNPTRTYSTGMQMRLAFATAVHAEPEILLIDEVLSVGDLSFQRKCLERIAQFREAGCSILLVSHEASVIQDLCDEALWLSAGRLMAQGPAMDVVHQYIAHMGGAGAPSPQSEPPPQAEPTRDVDSEPKPAQEADVKPRLDEGEQFYPAAASSQTTVRTDRGTELILNEDRFGSLELKISAVQVLDSDHRSVEELIAGQPLRIQIEYLATARLIAPIFCVRIVRADGLVCYDLSTEFSELSLAAVEGHGQATLVIDRVDLNTGRYLVDAGCFAQDWAYAYDFQPGVSSLAVRGDGVEGAVLNAPHRWEVSSREEGVGNEGVPASLIRAIPQS